MSRKKSSGESLVRYFILSKIVYIIVKVLFEKLLNQKKFKTVNIVNTDDSLDFQVIQFFFQ